MSAFNLTDTALHLSGAQRVVPLPGFAHDYDAYVAQHCTPADPGRILVQYTTTEAWPTWEVHPAGDEVVIVLSGRARFIQDLDGVHHTVEVGPGEVLINPAGVPHTADVIEPFTALYITPGPGTEHRERSGGAGPAGVVSS